MSVTRLPGCYYCGIVYPLRDWQSDHIPDGWVKITAQASFLQVDGVMVICPHCAAKRNYVFSVPLDKDDWIEASAWNEETHK